MIGILIGALLFGGGVAFAVTTLMADPSNVTVYVDGDKISVDAVVIDEANYFKLRDFAKAVNVGVWYDEPTDSVYIETDIGYDPKYTGHRPAPTTPLTPIQKSVSVDVDSKRLFDIGRCGAEGFSANITVVETIRGEPAAEIVKNANVLNPSAGIGKEYILARVRAKIVSSVDKKSLLLSDIRVNMNCYSSDGVKYPMSNPSNLNPINEQPATAGDTIEGWIAYVVDKNDYEPRIQIGGSKFDDPEAVWFKLYN
jgi:hypothetical protein